MEYQSLRDRLSALARAKPGNNQERFLVALAVIQGRQVDAAEAVPRGNVLKQLNRAPDTTVSEYERRPQDLHLALREGGAFEAFGLALDQARRGREVAYRLIERHTQRGPGVSLTVERFAAQDCRSLLGRAVYPEMKDGAISSVARAHWPLVVTLILLLCALALFYAHLWAGDWTVSAAASLGWLVLIVAGSLWQHTVWFHDRIQKLPVWATSWNTKDNIFREVRKTDQDFSALEIVGFKGCCLECGNDLTFNIERGVLGRTLVARCDGDSLAHVFELERPSLTLRRIRQGYSA